jgi:hypothetical protein
MAPLAPLDAGLLETLYLHRTTTAVDCRWLVAGAKKKVT